MSPETPSSAMRYEDVEKHFDTYRRMKDEFLRQRGWKDESVHPGVPYQFCMKTLPNGKTVHTTTEVAIAIERDLDDWDQRQNSYCGDDPDILGH